MKLNTSTLTSRGASGSAPETTKNAEKLAKLIEERRREGVMFLELIGDDKTTSGFRDRDSGEEERDWAEELLDKVDVELANSKPEIK